MKPSDKSPEIEEFLNTLSGDSRREAILSNRCLRPPIGCGGPATHFRDELSRREHAISGLCQQCQDKIF